MSVLIIGLALLIAHFAGSLWHPVQQRLFNAYLNRSSAFLKRFKLFGGGIAVLLILLPPLLLIAAGQYALHSGQHVLGAFSYALFFVILALGPRSLVGDVQAYLDGEDEQSRLEAAEALELPRADLEQRLDDGTALAALWEDHNERESLKIQGSPTYLFDGGRARLYGGFGYGILHATVDQLVHGHCPGGSDC